MDFSTATKTKVTAKFYEKAVHQPFKSEQEGKVRFDTVIYLQVITPGALTIVDRPMYKDEDEEKYPEAWDAFKRGKSAMQSGTPLDKWAGCKLDVADIKQMEAAGYFTVENVADMPDFDVGKFMGGQELKRRAKLFLEAAAGIGNTDRLMTEIQNTKDDLKLKDDQIKSMAEMIADLQANQVKDKSQKSHRNVAA